MIGGLLLVLGFFGTLFDCFFRQYSSGRSGLLVEESISSIDGYWTFIINFGYIIED